MKNTREDKKYRWEYTGESVTGASHYHQNKRNQDSIAYKPKVPNENEPFLIMAVADGHGSDQCFRSHIGSKLAVDIALNELDDFWWKNCRFTDNVQQLEKQANDLLAKKIVKQWLNKVEKHYHQNPVSKEELSTFPSKNNHNQEKTLKTKPQDINYMAYGSTLLAILISENFILYLQLGDGDILRVDINGKAESPIEKDPELMFNETTSLCQWEAWEKMKIKIEPIQSTTKKHFPLAMILVSTDGYSNSFSDEGFRLLGRDYLQFIKDNNFDALKKELPHWLKETTEKGSGDDITVGIVRFLDVAD